MNVVWSPEALEDLIAIRRYIERDDPAAAVGVVRRIVASIEEHLPDFPDSGRPGRVSGTRELLVPGLPYIVPYRIRAATIEVLRVYHAARRWPEGF